MASHTPGDLFAEASNRLLRGEAASPAPEVAADLALAARLRATAPEAAVDPEFAAGLRAQLLAGLRAAIPVASVRYAVLETPIGCIFVAYRDGKVVSADMAADGAAFERAVALRLGVRPELDEEAPTWLVRGVLDHLAGRQRFAAVDLSWLPPFQRRVLEKTAEIPRGEVRPYGWVAREIGAPGATRAVGTALGHNPIPFIVPCHRVVRADGSLGEYSGGGPERKLRVLEFEGAPVGLLLRPRPAARFRGSRSERFVCYPSCHSVRAIASEDVVEFASVAQAVAAGYETCSLCRPA